MGERCTFFRRGRICAASAGAASPRAPDRRVRMIARVTEACVEAVARNSQHRGAFAMIACSFTGERLSEEADPPLRVVLPRSLARLQSATDAFDALLGTDISGAPVARGDVSALLAEPLFIALYEWFLELGGVFRLPFGPKVRLARGERAAMRYVSARSGVLGARAGVPTAPQSGSCVCGACPLLSGYIYTGTFLTTTLLYAF